MMKYNIGETVFLVHTNEEVLIKDILSKTHYLVEMNSVQFPVCEEDLRYEVYHFSTKPPKPHTSTNEGIDAYHAHTDLALSFIPHFIDVDFESRVQYFRVYLVNCTKHNVHFEYTAQRHHQQDFQLFSLLSKGQSLYVHNIDWEAFSEQLKIVLTYHFENLDTKQPLRRFHYTYKPKAAQIIDFVSKLLVESHHHFLIPIPSKPIDTKPLIASEIEELKRLFQHKKLPKPSAKPQSISVGKAKYVLDIHIEKLLDEHKHLSHYEILQVQLSAVEKNLELALRENLPSTIVIHGVGTGKLRAELHKLLRTLHFVKKFANEYHPLYGFGATEIYL